MKLARKTKLSIDIVKYRLKLLTQKLVNSYRVMFDINKLGYYHYVVFLRMKHATKSEEEKLVFWCTSKKNILYCTKRIGYYDFKINVAIIDIEDLNAFLSELKTKFSDIIESYDLLINSVLLKLDYVPF